MEWLHRQDELQACAVSRGPVSVPKACVFIDFTLRRLRNHSARLSKWQAASKLQLDRGAEPARIQAPGAEALFARVEVRQDEQFAACSIVGNSVRASPSARKTNRLW
jgi:hypothetical protein